MKIPPGVVVDLGSDTLVYEDDCREYSQQRRKALLDWERRQRIKLRELYRKVSELEERWLGLPDDPMHPGIVHHDIWEEVVTFDTPLVTFQGMRACPGYERQVLKFKRRIRQKRVRMMCDLCPEDSGLRVERRLVRSPISRVLLQDHGFREFSEREAEELSQKETLRWTMQPAGTALS